MAQFIVSARKYRPETFKSVVGQDSITSTLKNAIRNNYLGHAYLFCGPRGVGKTTCARIFAKTINCYELGSESEPCNKCESCVSFNESRSYNIHELDAASNNSVDDIRTLIEKVRIPPQIGKYSVYIIDEVHMLSQQAFNAFLKTLEEPPAHAIFILATTEKHKIIPTILSRCQIFDFNRIKTEDAVNYLRFIADKENITYEPEALHIIAQKSDGAMRDALSIFDQVVSFSNNNIHYQDVINNLNILDSEYYFKITESFLNNNFAAALLLFDEILNDGFDTHNFLIGLAGHFRDLLVCTDPQTIVLLDCSDSIKAKYREQAAKCSPEFIFSALDICNELDQAYKSSKNQRLLVELGMVRLAKISAEKKKPDSDLIAQEGTKGPVNTLDSNSKIAEPELKANQSVKGDLKADQSVKGEVKADQPVKSESKADQAGKSESKADQVEKNYVANTSFSIKNVVSDQFNPEVETVINVDDSEIIADIAVEEENLFNDDDLQLKWTEFSEHIQKDRPRISIVLKNHKPLLGEGYSIDLKLDNSAQLNEFDKNIKNELSAFLKKELRNSFIQINAGIEETGPGKRMIYTAEERFQYLSGKYPELNRLKQQFNLEFE
jgi:DNA polymerase III subunit gamma/tau